MSYSQNILPKSAAYYTLSNASIIDSELSIEADGFAEIQISNQMLTTLTKKMLVVAHPSVFSSAYTNDAVQITLSIITSSGSRVECLIPVSYDKSGVFNTEVSLPEETYVSFTYRISSKVPVVLYNWELCAEEAVDVSTIIEGVEQELPKLLYDYNTYAFAVDQKAFTVGMISCFLHSDTDLQGHFTISFFATEKCNVHVRIKDNGVTELFSPQVFTVEKGYASISIPHAYLHKKATDHAFSVTMQCTNGQLSIPVRGMLYTIDGGYLATRLLDAGVDLQDISIRQVPDDMSPSEIWAIGFEGSHLLLKKREYSQLQRVNWTAVKDFGEGLEASVEFNGHWNNRGNSVAYTLETQDTPFVFIVDLEGNLIAYQGDDFSVVTVLDYGVSSIKACRGFSSMLYIEQDQGLIISYIKNGNAYYRQWAYVATSGEYTWLSTQTLYNGGDATFVSVHRLPDYRVGFCVTYEHGTKWYITDRTYVGQSVKTDIAKPRAKSFMVTSVIGSDIAEDTIGLSASLNTLEEQELYRYFTMTFSGSLVFLNNTSFNTLLKSIKVYVNDTALDASAIDVSIDKNVLFVIVKDGVRGGRTVRIDYNCPFLFIKAYNGSFAYIKQTYSWYLPLAKIHQKDTCEPALTSTLNVSVKEIITRHLAVQEKPSVDISSTLNLAVNEITTTEVKVVENSPISLTTSLSISVTQVGATPI